MVIPYSKAYIPVIQILVYSYIILWRIKVQIRQLSFFMNNKQTIKHEISQKIEKSELVN